MSARRMFSPKIVESDAFLDMPISTQALYFHLGMEADDDGFVNPKKVMRTIGVSEDDLKVLVTKRFVLPFENGVVVIKHWLINNMIRKDFYKETVYIDQKAGLQIKENKAYTENVNNLSTFCSRRLGKDRLGKDNTETQKVNLSISYLDFIPSQDIEELKQISSASEDQIKSKAQDLKDYCASHGKRYKDYRAFLRNAVKKDYPKGQIKNTGSLILE